MSDIVERLRTDWLALDTPLLDEAADEIERLRALLRDVAASRVIYPADWLDRVFDVQVEADTWAALDEFRTDHHDQEQ